MWRVRVLVRAHKYDEFKVAKTVILREPVEIAGSLVTILNITH